MSDTDFMLMCLRRKREIALKLLGIRKDLILAEAQRQMALLELRTYESLLADARLEQELETAKLAPKGGKEQV